MNNLTLSCVHNVRYFTTAGIKEAKIPWGKLEKNKARLMTLLRTMILK